MKKKDQKRNIYLLVRIQRVKNLIPGLFFIESSRHFSESAIYEL